MLSLLFEPIAKFLFVGIGYPIAYLPIVVGSLGTIEPGSIDYVDDGGVFYRSKGMKFWHLTYTDNGTRYLPAESVAFFGWLLLATISAGVWAAYQIAAS